MTDIQWQVSTSGPPWIVIDCFDRTYRYDTREEALQHVERDQKMVSRAAAEMRDDISKSLWQNDLNLERGQQATDSAGETETPRTSTRRTRYRRRRRGTSGIADC